MPRPQLILRCTLTSPFARKVRIAVAVAGLRHRCRCQPPPLVHQVCVEAVGHGDTRYRRFWLGAFGQNLGLGGCAVAPPDELLGVF